ncbi:hypothetical protein A3G67_03675 [Candidatus Roizmanbacteria bacterium RIFCSPLOWO2_12_FULL_40_12]|uniref:Uncharacterized protein n=1 Tax=Candidatus Roizmanbacteria bacterium RIFCSPLOWO2_01_FULL_40_42 TaxID=1802066 RepID=A0A1F7J5P7_9BACT|nr:MAG: hypothetical protein A2779_03310 [Candidatus Roizmanbacteria bacterium RIFCSPHIGHO2_01_FULL_40_98]OGK28366.1 MAG: hypothetical protein A3C31_00675 [Candidatus Roizmanbacteria bacterium RIFCSPHIGHO2_02_FULL_40_53]OGK30602.1 MAG: hypothetical protein A2W49_03360 [Candidatus Roizmanbacteria bacterium RIFCSPHIGHO2_12_41_18]OGK37016.1 MAG: hypothetical protein A3E69_00935 [Candidatus Roizmanbacteria bacterium RIFCSPHIGHO2_12_FULL_40_130]OGK50922.1 MAG: hypothetical protein A3B50_01445 [Candi
MSERGSYKPGVYTKVESFVGRQSLVAHLTDQQIVPIKITRLSPASQAVHEEIANALKEGQVLTKRDLLEMYERCGVPLSSISRLRFEVTSGRFLKRMGVSIRFIKDGRDDLLFDATRPESEFRFPEA